MCVLIEERIRGSMRRSQRHYEAKNDVALPTCERLPSRSSIKSSFDQAMLRWL
ncbi:hypothetical protein ASAP_3213 [Asaia bogorensis]|uniref:Uncharacterized protein n=1 Tax=Asaia bogorensis TaxID=91915 RepID=A0A060QKD0_9PROT|nr:hypothetical protein ASAP_3213 [Asaia bogorensis]